MLRELAEALEMLTAEQPLVLVLEDLHWSDVSTLDFIASIARRREPARLLLLGTYRPAEVALYDHPLHAVHHELQGHGLCAELPLTLLPNTAIAQYLALRFPEIAPLTDLVRLVHQRTDGNPLFMVNLVEDWVAQGWLVEAEGRWTWRVGLAVLQAGMPESLRQMLEMQLDRLTPEEQRVLEVGSVAGVEFSAAAVAAGLEETVVRTDERCAAMVRRSQLLRSRGEQAWPDGTVTGCYGFVHALYQEVLYSRLTAARRVYLHRQIGQRVEAGYGPQARDVAAELARHFEQGRDVRRTVMYLRQAAGNALRRYANQEAIDHLTKGLSLLQTLPATLERHQHELDLLLVLGPALTALHGYGAPEVEHTYTRARALCQYVGDPVQRFGVLRGLGAFYQQWGELNTTRALAEQLLMLAQETQDPALRGRAHLMQGSTLFYLGELAAARSSLAQAQAAYDPQLSSARAGHSGLHSGVVCRGHIAWALWLLGHPHQALDQSQTALAMAVELSHPHSLVYALHFACVVRQFRHEIPAVRERAEAVLALASEHGFAFWMAYGMVMRGWALALHGQGEEGIASIRQGLAAQRQTGAELGRSYFLALLAEACQHTAQTEEGMCKLTEALAAVAQTGEAFYAQVAQQRLTGVPPMRKSGARCGKSCVSTVRTRDHEEHGLWI
jgi:predicted ATPase